MTAVFSTSSPVASVALFRSDGDLLASAERVTQGNASASCLTLLESLLREGGFAVSDLGLYGADLGPGSFIGSRVAVTLAKTMAYAAGTQAFGLTAFELVGPGVVAIPSRKGEYFVKRDGEVAVLPVAELPSEAQGYGAAFGEARYPSARHADGLEWKPVSPFHLMPLYLLEPSISTPKKPYTARTAGG